VSRGARVLRASRLPRLCWQAAPCAAGRAWGRLQLRGRALPGRARLGRQPGPGRLGKQPPRVLFGGQPARLQPAHAPFVSAPCHSKPAAGRAGTRSRTQSRQIGTPARRTSWRLPWCGTCRRGVGRCAGHRGSRQACAPQAPGSVCRCAAGTASSPQAGCAAAPPRSLGRLWASRAHSATARRLPITPSQSCLRAYPRTASLLLRCPFRMQLLRREPDSASSTAIYHTYIIRISYVAE